ncbi:MAG: 4'-phosphopantetheinyl transferase superfamily protein [Alphaproteobacteria bacterium]|nr:4'-phosphopantetheinyl transferase superfamily protein [Alphaproteobacteria bacterium]
MVELFAADIHQIALRAHELIALLDQERQARVRAFGDSRSALQTLAAGLLLYAVFGEQTRSSHFERGRRGKPHLADHTPFNITHAGDYAVLALSSQTVGVDLERFRPLDWQRISERFFHPEERDYLAKSSEPEKDFFRIWTLKESYLKAEGTGFSVSPASFAVLPVGDQSAQFFGETDYRFTRLAAFPDYCLSVCSLEEVVADSVILKEF